MTTCDHPAQSHSQTQSEPGDTWSQWFAVFNWVNWLGLSLFLWPIVIGYFGVHAWLLQHDPPALFNLTLCPVGSDPGLMAAAMVTEWIDDVVFGVVGWLIGLGLGSLTNWWRRS